MPKVTVGPTNVDDRCLIEGCKNRRGNIKDFKGMCMSCHKRAKAKVAAGEVTWEQLESMGMAILAGDPFQAMLDRKTKEQSDGKS